ncbi:MAG: DUF2066 domain-containing protein [Alphaproteobacteria bacterium]|nr:MAG: DUF2066 domain-containing protein [Alphaproteobacteria bacterium]
MCIRRLVAPFGGLALSVVVLVAVIARGTGPAIAQDEGEIFTVRDVAVDVTAETAAAAREVALAQGHVAAMERLLARLLPREEQTRVTPPTADRIAELVKDFEVADERTSDVRYLARLTFRFNPDAVRAFLRNNDLAYAETRSKPVVVVPVYGPRGEARLWDDANPWWAVWARRRPDAGLVPLIVPLGDLGDISTLDAEQALAGDTARMTALAERYGAEDILLTQAILSVSPGATAATLQVGTSRIGRQASATVVETFTQQPGENIDGLLARAAEAIAEDVQESWKQRNLLRPGEARRIQISVPVRGLTDWLEIRRRLADVAGVERSIVTLMSRAATEISVTFVGDERQLAVAMAQNDLELAYDETLGWRLWIRGAPPPDVAAPAVPLAPAVSAPAAPVSPPPSATGSSLPVPE